MKGDVNMVKVLKKGICVCLVYLFAVLFVFLIGERITKLDKGTDFRNTNSSVSLTLEK
jgi:phosphate starvation-inducible membrane PsiE